MSGKERFGYFSRKVADFEKVWGLYQDGWAMAADDEGNKVIVLWPEEELASICSEGAWAGYVAKFIPLDAFLEKWIPGMIQDNVNVGVFPTPSDKGVIVQPSLLADAIKEELDGLM